MSCAPRSYLFVPGDAPDKMAKAAAGAADALILDLEDSVAPGRKDAALEAVCAFLAAARAQARPRLYVRLNGTDPDRALRELAALPLQSVAGLVWPKLSRVRELDPIAYGLDALEARDGLPKGSVGIVGIVTETAASLLNGADLGRGHPRLQGYTWGMEDLSADIGRAPLPGASDAGAALAEHARLFCLLVARAAGIDAIDAVDPDFRTPERLASETARGRDLGFSARMAIHPAQIAPIHQGLAPDAATLSWARRVMELAAAHPDLSAFQLDGRMVDRPHIRTAALILERSRVP
ncbi:CoA ester lyase [Aquabacter sp. L1I39]|uniref:HpcH/HpaI aldolase/citrate lyase family protein n=1 Tax=Aquabacter sp. L1I39 TaxID=2820278 RepID=UPI001ADB3565|nr:CoA ester lyase [Aquabacter sp. L1I39]QTL03761.1 CoA ester lyase [Aquabacter sp. L1I39]